MNNSLLRIMAGYSRLAFQEERKHQNVIGSLFQTNAYKAIFQNVNHPKNKLLGPETVPSFSHLHLPFLINNLQELGHSSVPTGMKVVQKQQNETNTIQYQANNGIEDRLVSSTLKSINADTISVFDGHGGDKLSDYCSIHIVDLLDAFIMESINEPQYTNDKDQLVIDALNYAYGRLEKDFYQNIYLPLTALNNRKIKNVGTCALTLVIYNKKIFVANCGDSQAILVSQTQDQKVTFLELNERLSVNNAIERERLIQQFPEDPDIVVEEGSGSFYVKGRLQPTRSIGDYHLKHSHLYKGKGKFNGPYVKSEPQIKIFDLKKNDKAIVIGSDGVWDFAEKQAIAQASLMPNPHEEILQNTLQKIAEVHNKSIDEIKEVEADQKRAFHDDISVGVVILGSLNRSSNTNA